MVQLAGRRCSGAYKPACQTASVVLEEVRHAGGWDIAFLAEFPVMHK
jgi:hypothetical protein